MANHPTAATTEQVFQQAVEALFHVGLRGKVTPELQARLRGVGLDLSLPLAPAYPRATWNEALRVTAETLWPDEPAELAFHALGRQQLRGHTETLVGRALATVLRVLGPRRTLDRMTHTLRSSGNYTVTRVTHLGRCEALLWMNEPDLPPAYVAGILEGALELAGAAQVDIRVDARDAEGCTYRVSWGP